MPSLNPLAHIGVARGPCPRKGRELAEMMVKRKVYILCGQETRWKGSKARNIRDGCKVFYHGEDGRRNGVGVILKEDYIARVLEVKRVSDRMMYMKLDIEGVMMTVISAYASQLDCYREEKDKFWTDLDEVAGLEILGSKTNFVVAKLYAHFLRNEDTDTVN